jgi:hypothetical protein
MPAIGNDRGRLAAICGNPNFPNGITSDGSLVTGSVSVKTAETNPLYYRP